MSGRRGSSGAELARAASTVADELTRAQILIALSDAGVLTPTALNLAPVFEDKPLDTAEAFEVWAQFGPFFGRVHRSAKWWLGDWLNFGEGAFGERYAQAADTTGLSIGYLQNIAWVARSVAPSRRRDGVAFSLHSEVASLPPPLQTQWLDEAIEAGWSQRDLRLAIKATNGPANEDGDDDDERHDSSRRPLSASRILETAKLCARRAQRDGDTVRVPLEAWSQLLAAIGEGD